MMKKSFHQYIEAFVNKKNINFIHAYNGKQALDLYMKHESTLSLVLLDIIMPVMDGVVFLRRLRSKRDVICPVIVLSGWLSEKDTKSCLALGAKEVLHKPISPDKLVPRINCCLTKQ